MSLITHEMKKSSHLICKSSNIIAPNVLYQARIKGYIFLSLRLVKKCLHFGELIVSLSLINIVRQLTQTELSLCLLSAAHITVLRIFKCALFYTVTDWF